MNYTNQDSTLLNLDLKCSSQLLMSAGSCVLHKRLISAEDGLKSAEELGGVIIPDFLGTWHS